MAEKNTANIGFEKQIWDAAIRQDGCNDPAGQHLQDEWEQGRCENA